eukprot:gene18368-24065_t
MSKHLGTRGGGDYKGLTLFWDCCNEENINGIGCKQVDKILDDKKMSDGLEISINPWDVMENTPISEVDPNLFLVVRSNR